MRKKYLTLFCAAILMSGAAMSAQAAEAGAAQEIQETVQTQETQEDGVVLKASEILEMQASYEAYADLVSQYEAKYGAAALDTREYSAVMTGLCFLRLVDFNQDNIEELVLAYNHESEPSSYSVGEYTWEVWSYGNGQAVLLASDALYMSNGYAQSVELTQYEGNWYLVSGSADSFEYNYYYGFDADQFGLVREALMEETSDASMSCSINGSPVSTDQWRTEENAWLAGLEIYRMNYVDNSEELLALYNKTKASLGIDTASSAPEPDSTDYILPGSSQEYLTSEMLQGLSADDLMIARNEIFARHGRRFNTPELQQYFESKSWYVPKYTPEEFEAIQYTELSEIEWANIDLINAVEAGSVPDTSASSAAAIASQVNSTASASGAAGQTASAGSSVQTAGTPVDDPESVFAQLPDGFWFSSGAGAWSTDLSVNADGSFTGEFFDSNMGDSGEGYNGSVYFCNFSGRFSSLQKVSDYIYSMKLDSLETEGTAGEQYIEDGVLYVNSDPYGMENGENFLIYLPGTPISEVADEFLTWAFLDPGLTALPSDFCGIYNVNAQHGFVGRY